MSTYKFGIAPTWQNRQAQVGVPSARQFVSVERVISKRSAKHDKIALKYARTHGIKPALPNENGYYSAGLKDRFNGRQSLGKET